MNLLDLLFALVVAFVINGIFQENRNERAEPPKYWNEYKSDTLIWRNFNNFEIKSGGAISTTSK